MQNFKNLGDPLRDALEKELEKRKEELIDKFISATPGAYVSFDPQGDPRVYVSDPLSGEECDVTSTVLIDDRESLTKIEPLQRITSTSAGIGTRTVNISSSAGGSTVTAAYPRTPTWTTVTNVPAWTKDAEEELETFEKIKDIYTRWYPDDPAEFDENTFKELPSKVMVDFAQALKKDIEAQKMKKASDVIEYLRKKGLVV